MSFGENKDLLVAHREKLFIITRIFSQPKPGLRHKAELYSSRQCITGSLRHPSSNTATPTWGTVLDPEPNQARAPHTQSCPQSP